MPLRETAIGGATVAIRRCIEQGIPTFRPRLFQDQPLGRCPAAMGSITVLSTAHIPAKSFRTRASTMALAKPNPRRGSWVHLSANVRPPAKAGPAKCCATWIDGGGGPTRRIIYVGPPFVLAVEETTARPAGRFHQCRIVDNMDNPSRTKRLVLRRDAP